MSANLNFRLNKPQSIVFPWVRPEQTVVTPWSRGTGKSFYLRLLCWLLIAQYDGRRVGAPTKGVRITWFMDTLKHWKKVHADLMELELDGPWKRLGGKINKTDWTVRFPGGSITQVFPAAAAHSQAGLGQRADVVVLDECDDIDIAVYNSVMGPFFSEPCSLRMRLCSGTPRRGRYGLLYHLHKLGLDPDPALAHYHTHHATYRDCLGDQPGEVHPATVEDARNTWPKVAFQREWECSFDSAEGLVYDMFDEGFHVREPADRTVFTNVIVGVDWGMVHAGVMLVAGITGHGDDAQAWLIEEHYAPGRSIDQWVQTAAEIKGRYPSAKWHADPSQPATMDHIGHHAHVNIAKADNRIQQGVACVADKLFKRGPEKDQWARLYVHPDCKNTIREFGAYRRKADPHNAEAFMEDIVDRNDDAMDALRYMMMGRFGEPPSVRVESEPGHYS